MEASEWSDVVAREGDKYIVLVDESVSVSVSQDPESEGGPMRLRLARRSLESEGLSQATQTNMSTGRWFRWAQMLFSWKVRPQDLQTSRGSVGVMGWSHIVQGIILVVDMIGRGSEGSNSGPVDNIGA